MSEHEIAVLHPDCVVYGGAEAVCLSTIEALQDAHDVTLFTLVRPKFAALNDHFGTSVDPAKISVETVSAVIPWVYETVGKKLGVLAASYLNRRVRRVVRDFDITISTKDEFALEGGVQYVHFPRFYRRDMPTDMMAETLLNSTYDRLCRAMAGFSKSSLATSEVLTNSAWTAGVIEDIYSVEPAVVHPPVNTEQFTQAVDPGPEEWREREDGFVSVGRITPDKNLIENIEIVRRLNDAGFDAHLHIVGPLKDGVFDSYADTVREQAASSDCVHLEGSVQFEDLADLLQKHKYGLHGKRNEHFGMSVAEMVAAGMVPFLPDSGGQTGIVDKRQELLYSDVADAVDTILPVLGSPDMQLKLRAALPDVTARYGRERFKNEIRHIVAESLAD